MNVAIVDGRAAFAIVSGPAGPEVLCRTCGARGPVPAGAPLALLVHADACPMAALRGLAKPLFMCAEGRAIEVVHESRSRLA